MKKILLSTASLAMLLFASCSTQGEEQQGVIIESETDSIVIHDTVPQMAETFIFQGTTPMNGNAVADVILAISSVSLNDDGTYSITTDYIDEGLATQNDNGEAIILTGMDNDSTITVIELVSANRNPTMSFMMQEDSTLVKVDKKGKPASKDPSHKLTLKNK